MSEFKSITHKEILQDRKKCPYLLENGVCKIGSYNTSGGMELFYICEKMEDQLCEYVTLKKNMMEVFG